MMPGKQRFDAPRLVVADREAPPAASGPDSVTRQAGVAGAGPGAGLAAGRGAGSAGIEVRLRIIATTDIHATILSYDYAANRPLFGQGLAQTATLIAAARADAPGALLLDNGDFLQGSALADLAAAPRRRRAHPVIAAFNALGYDAATLGNHEFNFGLEVLGRALAAARFPVVSANVLLRRGPGPLADRTLVPPFALIDRELPDQSGALHRLRIGILGLTPPEILTWDREHLEGRLETRPMLEAAAAWVPELRRAGADLVVCLAHTGIAAGPCGPDTDGKAIEIAALDGVDAVVAGHSHTVFPDRGPHADPRINPDRGTIAGKPVVQPGHGGSHLGVIDLHLRKGDGGSDGTWTVASGRGRAISVSEVVAGLPAAAIRHHAEPLRRAIAGDHRATLSWTRKALCTSGLAMSSCFAQVADVPAMRLLGLAKIAHARRALAATAHAGLPLVATATPYRSGGRGGALNYTGLPAGALSVRHLFDLYPFPNTVVTMAVTGAELAEILERAAALYRQMRPGLADQPLIDPAFPGFGFTTIFGLDYRIDLTRPARYDPRGRLIRPDERRIARLLHGGRPVGPEDRFALVTNSYRAGGALGLPRPRPEDLLLETRTHCTTVLRSFLEGVGTITRNLLSPPGAAGWGFLPVPGATATFDTGTAAAAHVDEAAHLHPEPIGLTEEGFHRYRLHFPGDGG